MQNGDDFWQTIFESQTKADDPALSISAQRFAAPEPLDAQLGAYPALSTPQPFHAPLFGPLPGRQTSLATYAILDAARIAHLAERLETSGLHYTSLFSGEAETELADVAPYLVTLTEDHPLTRHLFTGPKVRGGLWQAEAGIFLRSALELPALRSHLRHFTRLQDHTGQWFFFRFWDPAVARIFLNGLRLRSDAARRWFETRNGLAIAALLVPQTTEADIALEQFSPTASCEGTAGGGLFRLQETDHGNFRQARLESDVNQIIRKVMTDFSDLLPEASRGAYPRRARRCLSWLMEMGIRQKPNLLTALVWDLAYGPDLFQTDPVLRDILGHPDGEAARMLEMTAHIETRG